jgi:hypothetical protein
MKQSKMSFIMNMFSYGVAEVLEFIIWDVIMQYGIVVFSSVINVEK